MEERVMKKTVEFIAWMWVVLTIVSLLFTLSTAYSFMYIKYFTSYYTLQWCLFFTMLFWAVKLYNTDTGAKKYIYTGICLLFAAVSIFFIVMKVSGRIY
jgi:hypothetical protein